MQQALPIPRRWHPTGTILGVTQTDNVWADGSERGRTACLRALISGPATAAYDTLVVIEQDDSLIYSDRRLLYQAVRAAGRADSLRYEHRRREAEILLGIPDAIAWCWAKGGRWRKPIDPTVSATCHV